MLERINGLWIGRRLSRVEQLSIKSFLALGHPYRLYCYNRLEGVPAGTELADARRFLSQERAMSFSNLGMASNYFRYQMLWEEGGWWCDLDTVALKPFVFRQPVVFGSLWKDDYYGMGALRAPPRWAVMQECLRRIAAEYGTTAAWNMTGPHTFTQVVNDLGQAHFKLPEKVFYPFQWEQCGIAFKGPAQEYPDSHAVHLWHEWSSRNRIDMNATYPPETLFETLHRRYPDVPVPDRN